MEVSMPYTVPQLEKDDRFKSMPTHAIEIFVAAFNAATDEGKDEATCFKIGWAAVGEKYRKDDAGKWAKFSQSLQDIIQAVQRAVQDKFLPAPSGNGVVDACAWVKEVFPSETIFEMDEKTYSVPWEMKDGVVILGEKVEVEEAYLPVKMSFDDTSIDTVLDAALARGDITLFSAEIDPDGDALITKDAKLFEAGRYDDKGIEVFESDLDRWIGNFQRSKIGYEHDGKPLHFGWLEKIWRKGKELYGRLAFKPGAFETAKDSNLNKLSVEIPLKKDYFKAVNLVYEPRIADAGFEFAVVGFSVVDTDTKPKEAITMADEPKEIQNKNSIDPAEVVKARESIEMFKSVAPGAQAEALRQIGAMTDYAQSGERAVIEMGKVTDAYFQAQKRQKAEIDIAHFKMEIGRAHV
jgi:cation transport regulator ChaB